VLASKLVAEPLHALECPMLADGAVAFVMTSAENAKSRGLDSVRVAGSGGCVSHYSIGQEPDLAALGWATAAGHAYEQSGWGPKDAQIAQIYDTYAAVTTIDVEGLGFCDPVTAPVWLPRALQIPAGGYRAIPMAACCRPATPESGGGTALLVEGVRQLLGRAESERQVPGVERCIVGGTGGSYMDAQVLLLERLR